MFLYCFPIFVARRRGGGQELPNQFLATTHSNLATANFYYISLTKSKRLRWATKTLRIFVSSSNIKICLHLSLALNKRFLALALLTWHALR